MAITDEERARHAAEIADAHAVRAGLSADRAHYAAGLADARARDADRIVRWGVAFVLAVLPAIWLQLGLGIRDVQIELGEIRAVLDGLTASLTSAGQ